MSNSRVVRQVCFGAYRSALRRVNDDICNGQTRGFSLIRLMRGVHDVVGHALTMGEQAAGIKPYTLPLETPATKKPQTLDPRYASADVIKKSNLAASPWHTSSPAPPTADPRAHATLSEQVRSVMRLLPHPVVVCTSRHGSTPRAMTMSSFTSLTLSPTPLVTFNIAAPSRTLDAIASSRHFNIHITSGDTSGVAIADRFTRGNTEDVFNGLEYTTSQGDETPLLQGEGILYVLRCSLLPDEATRGLVKVRDHVIVVGEVMEMIPGSSANEFGLAYADRKYRQVGGVISKD